MTNKIAELLENEELPESEQKMTTEQMQEFLRAQNKLRAEQCAAKIAEALEEFNCRIDVIEITRNGILEASRVDIRPL